MKLELNSNKSGQIAIHVFVWAFLFSMPYFLTYNKFENMTRLAEHTWVPLVLYALSFYLNYFWITDKLFEKDKRYIFIVANLGIIAGLVVLNVMARHWFFQKMLPPPEMGIPPHFKPGMKMHKPFSFFMYTDTISFLIPVMFSVAIRALERWSKSELQKKAAEKERLDSELQHLKYQLQPHFFFNSLNNIYALVDINPERAKESIHGLSKLMRYMLYESDTERVSLKQELDFMTRYIDLMAMRCSEKTSVHYYFPKENIDLHVPPLLFISLIENAFKHGVSATVKTNIEFKIETSGGRVFFEASNNNLPKSDSDKSGSGIGLDNLRKRLDLLFPGNYFLSEKVENERFVVKMSFSV